MKDASSEQRRAASSQLPTPSSSELLGGVLQLGREVHLEMDEAAVVELFLDIMSQLFCERAIAVRVFDPRSSEQARGYVRGGALRPAALQERVVLPPSSISKTRLKTSIANSARLKLGERWESPFVSVAFGFTVPLVASGELYGVLDVGYSAAVDGTTADEPILLPIANHLSVALRNERLHREASVLRDYQATLIEHANALILGVDRHWRITVCNQALCRLTGYAHDEIVGRDLRDWLPPQERARISQHFVQALEGGGSEAIDLSFLGKDGQQIRTMWSIATIARREHVEAVVAVGHDQTKLRELQRQVVQAEKLATLGQLAAGVAHELNNPLTSISVYAEYLLKKFDAARADSGDIEKLRRIADGAQRILSFARDLVQYAKPAGDDLEVIDLNQVVGHSMSFCEHLFERSAVQLECCLAEPLPPLHAVPGQLDQVVVNLVTNAVHAARETGGPGRVRIVTTVEDGWVVLTVEDDGSGIAACERDKIFEPFYSTKIGGEGTGLGLSIVKNIVEQHRGRIDIGDAPAGGAKVRVTLPALR